MYYIISLIVQLVLLNIGILSQKLDIFIDLLIIPQQEFGFTIKRVNHFYMHPTVLNIDRTQLI